MNTSRHDPSSEPEPNPEPEPEDHCHPPEESEGLESELSHAGHEALAAALAPLLRQLLAAAPPT